MKVVVQKIFHALPIPWQIRLKRKVDLLYNEAGYGDTLLVGAVAREIKKKYGNVKITVHRVKEELLRNNPNVDETGHRYNGIDLNYHYGKINVGNHFDKNIIDIMCRKVGVRNVQHTVDIFLTDEERAYAEDKIEPLKRPIITIHATPGSFGQGRKLWPLKYWKKLISMLNKKEYTILQLGSAGEPHIEGSLNLLGTQDIRRSIALMNSADLHIGIVSSLMHGAAAVGTRAIILFGGFERFMAHNYSNIYAFESNIPCAPCIRANTKMEKCPLHTQCMREITPEKVHKKVLAILEENSSRKTEN